MDAGSPLSPAELAYLGGARPLQAIRTPRPAPVVVAAPAPTPKPKAKAKPKAAPKPRQLPPEPAAFNALQFHKDLMAAARQLGVTSSDAVAKDAGVRAQAIRTMRRGLPPSLATCLVLCDWAGLDPLRYMVHLAPAAANDTSARAAA